MENFVNTFKALSDKTRLRIMCLLSKGHPRLSVSEIMDALNENQYNVSRHLKILKIAGLIKAQREGRWGYYSLVIPPNQAQEFVFQAVLGIPEEFFSLDGTRLKHRLALRENGKTVIGINSKEWRKVLNRLPS